MKYVTFPIFKYKRKKNTFIYKYKYIYNDDRKRLIKNILQQKGNIGKYICVNVYK